MKKAVITGSFDPITLGHQWIIEKASVLFEEVVVVIAKNVNKKSYFEDSIKKSLVEDFCKTLPNVSVVVIENQFVADYAKQIGAGYLVRGIRNAQDLEYERTIERVNTQINSALQTIFLMPPVHLSEISSSLVKSLVGFIGWHKQVSKMVSPSVYSAFMDVSSRWYLQERWKEFSSDEETFNMLMKKHTEPHRFYHNTSHLVSLLENLEKFNLERHKKGFLTYMIFFHDAIYNPMAKDNEEQSAQLYEAFAEKSGLTDHLLKKGIDVILGTKHHATAPSNELLDTFLDLDLSILGSSLETFLEYEQNIRLEYGFVPDSIYEVERAKVMKTLKGEYRTETGKVLWQALRDENLKKY